MKNEHEDEEIGQQLIMLKNLVCEIERKVKILISQQPEQIIENASKEQEIV